MTSPSGLSVSCAYCSYPDTPLYGVRVIPQCLVLLFPLIQRWRPNKPVLINSFVKNRGNLRQRILLDENVNSRVEQLRQARERRTFSAASQPVVASTSRDLVGTSSTQAAVSSDTVTDSSVTVNADNARDNTVADIVASMGSRSEIVIIIGIMYSLYRA